MSVLIKNVIPGSPADKAGIKPGARLICVDGNRINDVLDYTLYADEDMGLEFETFLMDEKHHCSNNCIFCFIDQNPPGMRESVYFKDDDSRLSFLQGNYITLTNLTEYDINRIIRMKTPVNVSVHTTNPDLRVKMMGNPRAGESLNALYRFAQAGISMNCQLVVCPGINDGGELVRTLDDLTGLKSVESIACVPVGLTRYRKGLAKLRSFTKSEAADVIKTAGGYGNVFCADEFYLNAGITTPEFGYYGSFPQYENGVGMLTYLNKVQFTIDNVQSGHKISIATGTAAFDLISTLVKAYENVQVFAIRNDFFGESVSVSGLVVGSDIIAQLRGFDLGGELLIPANMLNCDGLFLDGTTPADVERELGLRLHVKHW
jgi:putative radical SAM enzyme (TIGR03279 family)